MKQVIYAIDPGKNKPIKAGVLLDGKVFQKQVKRTKHLIRKFDGYAIQMEVFNDLKRAVVEEIQIIEKDTGAIYTSTLKDWLEHGANWTVGHGTQRTLCTKYMTCINQKVG